MRLLVQLAEQYPQEIPLQPTLNLSLPTANFDVGQIPLANCADILSPFGSETPTAEDQALDRMAHGFGADVTNQPSFMAFMFVGHKSIAT